MNWKLIFVLSLLGLATAIPTLFGYTPILIWPIVVVVCVWFITGRAARRFALHGFIVGVAIQIVNGLVEAYYLHDLARAGIVQVSWYDLGPQTINLLVTAALALVTGALLALIVSLAARPPRQPARRTHQ